MSFRLIRLIRLCSIIKTKQIKRKLGVIMAYTMKTNDLLVPTETEAVMAGEASRILATLTINNEIRIELKDDKNQSMAMVLPSSIVRMIQHVLTEMSNGNAVTVMPINAEMTTQEAADFLNVSRPFIVKQIEAGVLPHHKIGTHRRISVQDLLTYKKKIDQEREQALTELTSEAQRLGLGY